ncbi:MAG: D-alanyl-D-alanine carboxypeptidase/D-alanyl-D-alanine-endopeptidase [Methylotenera sp.]|nr:D-alanyl-D-alanine carboxypeptidase/D-alanyl-D-alanine-endopeptidase [Methylotenera sp.]
MKKHLFCLLLGLASLTAKADLPSEVTEALSQAGVPLEQVAVVVQAVDSEQPSVLHNPEKSLNPASLMKLVTSNAALELLGPNYRWKTELYYEGSISHGVLTGNLIIKGYGDPNFTSADFWRLLSSLKQAGIQEIKGDLILDKSHFAAPAQQQASFDNEVWRAYNALPSAFLVNGRHTRFKFSPNSSEQNAVSISSDLALPQLDITNNMRLLPGACRDWRNHLRYTVSSETVAGTEAIKSIIFSGTYAADCGERFLELSLFNDELYAYYSFKQLWQALGGKFSGQLQVKQGSSLAIKLLEQQSQALSQLLPEMNKWSNNLMARQLLLTIAAEKMAVPATEVDGATAITRWFNSKPGMGETLVIENGSGLSRIERISADALARMLMQTYRSPVMPEFISSLSVLALDGTLMRRLKDSPVAKRAHIKTGSLDGVSAIAGYVLDKQNRRQVLVMLVNHEKSAASKLAQDALIEWVYRQP